MKELKPSPYGRLRARKSYLSRIKDPMPIAQSVDEAKERDVVDAWHRMAALGFATSDILAQVGRQTGIKVRKVRAIALKHNIIEQGRQLHKEIKEEVLKDKIAILKNIVGTSLSTLKEYLDELSRDKERLHSLRVSEAKGLSDVAKNLNELLRLELGQTTQNVQVVEYSYNETKVMLEDLKKMDPVFEYPALGEDEEDPESAGE